MTQIWYSGCVVLTTGVSMPIHLTLRSYVWSRGDVSIMMTPFLTFCFKVLFPAPFLMQFETLIPNILLVFFLKNTQTVELAGLLKFKFWSILPVFVILCGVQSTR